MCNWCSVQDLQYKFPRQIFLGNPTEHLTWPALTLCLGFHLPKISAATLSPDLLSNLSWFLIRQHPMLQTVYWIGNPVWFYIESLSIILWFWIVMSPQSSSTDRFVQPPVLSFPVHESNFNQHHRRRKKKKQTTSPFSSPSYWI